MNAICLITVQCFPSNGFLFNVKFCTLFIFCVHLLACTKYTLSIRCSPFNICILILNAICVKITGGQWSKAWFCPPGGRSYKSVTPGIQYAVH